MFNRRDDFNNYFYYDETSPTCLRWNICVRAGRKHATVKFSKGDVAGGRGKGKKYYTVQLEGVTYTCHRIVYELCHGNSSGLYIDHKNQMKFDNRSENLRGVARVLNHRNYPRRKDCSSGVVGVNLYHKNSPSGTHYFWRGRVSLLDGKRYSRDFSVDKYGYDKAFELAKLWREEQIALLNEAGAGYSETHGADELCEVVEPFYNNGFTISQ